MKNFYLPSFLLFTIFVIGSISWTDPQPDELKFPYQIYDFNPIFDPGYEKIEIDKAKANLGRVLFYDKLLSVDGSTSCASCHKQEFSFGDNKTFSKGINNTLTTRNTQNLNDIGWQGADGFFWDFKSQNLEEAVLQPILNPNELGLEFDDLIQKMKTTDIYSPLFEYAFGDDEISEEKIAIALSEFIRSMVTLNSKYDRTNFSSMTDSENLGLVMFHNNCSNCHNSPNFGTDSHRSPYNSNFILNNGLDKIYNDPGWDSLSGVNNNLFSNYAIFKTPTLRNLKYTAPYMHDGRFETLEEVIEFYSRGIQDNSNSFASLWYYGAKIDTITGERGFLFTEEEKKGLLDFLNILNDDLLITQPRWSDPFLEEPVEKPEPVIQFNIYAAPNPIETSTTIHISNSTTDIYDLVLINSTGKIVQEIKTEGGCYNLERNNLSAGIYFLQIRKDDLKYSMKLLFL